MMDITAHGMLIDLNLGVWMGTKLNKDAGADVVRSNGGDDAEGADVTLRLVSKSVLKPVKTAKNAIYLHHIDRTLPWKDKGARLLPRKMYETYIKEHAPLEQAFMDEADRFVDIYAQERDRAAFRLGTLFDPGDYPHPDDIRERFYCRLQIEAIAASGDFRVNLNPEAVDMIKADIEARTHARIFNAQADVWKRIEDTVMHFAGRMAAQMDEPEEGQKRAPLHQSTIDNLIHLVNSLAALNIVDDPNIKKLGKRLHALLTRYNDADQLKGNITACTSAHDEVQDILADVGNFKRMFEASL